MIVRAWSGPVGRLRLSTAALTWAVAAAALAGCGAGEPEVVLPSTTTTVPLADTDPGTAVLFLGAETFELDVTECALAPSVDPATNVSTDLRVVATDGTIAVEVRQETFTTQVVTVTETVDVETVDGRQLVEARRVDAGGRLVDLRVPDAAARMISRPDGTLLIVEGRFGSFGARGPEDADVDGRLVVRCGDPGGS